MSLLERLRKAKAPKKKEEEAQLPSDEELKEKLQSFLYSEEIVEEYLPVFKELWQHKAFAKVMEVIEAKETELEAMSQGKNFFERESNEESEAPSSSSENEEESSDEDYLMNVLEGRYGDT